MYPSSPLAVLPTNLYTHRDTHVKKFHNLPPFIAWRAREALFIRYARFICYLLVFYILIILWLIRNPRQESTPRYCLTANSQTLLPENAPQKGGAAKQGQCPACRPGGPGSISIIAEQAVGPLGKVRLVSSDRRVLIPTPRKGSSPPWGGDF